MRGYSSLRVKAPRCDGRHMHTAARQSVISEHPYTDTDGSLCGPKPGSENTLRMKLNDIHLQQAKQSVGPPLATSTGVERQVSREITELSWGNTWDYAVSVLDAAVDSYQPRVQVKSRLRMRACSGFGCSEWTPPKLLECYSPCCEVRVRNWFRIGLSRISIRVNGRNEIRITGLSIDDRAPHDYVGDMPRTCAVPLRSARHFQVIRL